MPATIHPDLQRAFDVVEQFRNDLDKLNAGPHSAPVPAEQPGGGITKRVLAASDMLEMQRQLRKLSTSEVFHAFSAQVRREDTGIPLSAWMAAGGAQLADAVASNPQLAKALDSSSGAALVRQDLEPIMHELFVRVFPAVDRIAKEPANGLVHTYTQQTGFGGAEHMSELGTVTDDRGTYVRQTTNIAIIATRRGVTLKHQYAALQSGSGFNPEQLEMRSALLAISSKLQQDIFHGNANPTESAGTDAVEAGQYDEDGFTGLRQILNTGRAKDVNPFAATPEDMRAAWDRAAVEIMDAGGTASIVYARATDKTTFDLQQDKNVRYDRDLVDVAVGVQTNAVNTVFGPLPVVAVPGSSIGTYQYSSWGANGAADTYMLDEGTISLPYLGSPGPQIIEIPMGVGGQLTRQFIVFGMWGLAVKAIQFSNKVRVKQS
jgi:hypothetical protein